MQNHSNRSYDSIVIGAGVLGASIFFHLAQSGQRVAVLEHNKIGTGCTAWSGGIVRCYHGQSILSDKATFSWHYYKNFEKHTGEYCPFHTSGFLYFPDHNQLDFAKLEAQRLAQKVAIEWLDSGQLQEQFGDLLQPNNLGAVYEPESGYMDPVAVTQAWIRSGLTQGGEVYEQTLIQDWQFPNQGGAVIQTDLGQFSTKNLIIAAGANTPFLLTQLSFAHDLYAQMIQVDVRKPSISVKAHPAYIDDQFNLNGRPNPEQGSVYIGHPTYLRLNHLKEHAAPDLNHSVRIEHKGRKRWQWVEHSTLLHSLRAPDCYTPDGLGRVQQILDQKGLYVASGFSGGGFKMAPWVGQHIVELISKNKEVVHHV